MAAGCAALFALVVLGAYFWHPGQTLDEKGLAGFVEARDGWLREASWRFTELGNPAQVATITLALAAFALLRGRPRLAVGVLALVAATSVSGQALKALLAHMRFPAIFDYPVGPEALPSGHATAAMTVALCAVLVAPPALRVVTALLGGAFAAAVGYAVLVLGWHFPSDVLGGFLMAGTWTALAVAGLRVVERRPAAEGPASARDPAVGIGVAAGAMVAAAVVAAAPGDRIALYASERPTLVVGALVIAALAGALSAGLARAA